MPTQKESQLSRTFNEMFELKIKERDEMRKKRAFLLQGWKNEIPEDINRKLLIDESPEIIKRPLQMPKQLSTSSASFKPKNFTQAFESYNSRTAETLLASINTQSENDEGNLKRFIDVSTPVINQDNHTKAYPTVTQLFDAVSQISANGLRFEFEEVCRDGMENNEILVYVPQLSILKVKFKKHLHMPTV